MGIPVDRNTKLSNEFRAGMVQCLEQIGRAVDLVEDHQTVFICA